MTGLGVIHRDMAALEGPLSLFEWVATALLAVWLWLGGGDWQAESFPQPVGFGMEKKRYF